MTKPSNKDTTISLSMEMSGRGKKLDMSSAKENEVPVVIENNIVSL